MHLGRVGGVARRAFAPQNVCPQVFQIHILPHFDKFFQWKRNSICLKNQSIMYMYMYM